MNTNVLSPTEDIDLLIESLIKVEGHTHEAAIAGAQKYAIEYSHDLRERAEQYTEAGFHIIAENLRTLAYEYRKLAKNIASPCLKPIRNRQRVAGTCSLAGFAGQKNWPKSARLRGTSARAHRPR